MKRILITGRLDSEKAYEEVRTGLDIKWGELFNSIECIPVMFQYSEGWQRFLTEMNIGSLVISGGNDLSSISDNRLSRMRDRYELALIEFAMERNMPIVGICRGMQLISGMFGVKMAKVDGHVATRHKLKVYAKDAVFRKLGEDATVNSFHNWTPETVPDGFEVVAEANDGVKEALVNRKRKIFLQMWHPERENPLNEVQLSILKYYLS